MSALNVIGQMLHTISDHGNVIVSKVVSSVGILSLGTAATIGAISSSFERLLDPSMWTWADLAAIVAIVGSATFIFKNVVDIYFTIRNRGK